jgi:hypothetical protein
MTPMIEKLTDAAAGVAAAGIVGAIWLNLKWLFTSKRDMEKILVELVSMRANVTILFRLQGPQLMSLKATLEAQRDGKCNGNVDKALAMIDEAKKDFDNHLLAMLSAQGNGTLKPESAGGAGRRA